MATITEDYVSFETAKLLKEKGFNELTAKAYPYFEGKDYKYDISCPTIQMAMKWLRIEHNIFIEPMAGENDGRDWYDFDIIPINGRVIHWTSLPQVPVIEYDSPEEAIEEALKYCLENLV